MRDDIVNLIEFSRIKSHVALVIKYVINYHTFLTVISYHLNENYFFLTENNIKLDQANHTCDVWWLISGSPVSCNPNYIS